MRWNGSRPLQSAIATLVCVGCTSVVQAASGPPHTEGDPTPHSTNPSKTDSGSSDSSSGKNNSSSSSNGSSNSSSSNNSNNNSNRSYSGWCWPHFDFLSLRPSRSTLERLNIQVGTFSPVANAIPTTDSSWQSLEISYSLTSPHGNHALFVPSVYLDTAGTDGENVYSSHDVNVTNGRMLEGLGLAECARIPLFHGKAAASFGAGGGLYCLETFHHYSYQNEDDGSDCGCSADDYHTDRAGLRGGYRLFAGINHKNGLYAEVGWINAGSMNGLGYSGSTIAVGFRR